MAESTNTDLTPEMEPSPDWVEQKILGTELSALQRQLEEEAFISALNTIEVVQPVFRAFVGSWNTEQATREFATTAAIVLGRLPPLTVSSGHISESREALSEKVGLAESSGHHTRADDGRDASSD